MKINFIPTLILTFLFSFIAISQNPTKDSIMLKKLYNTALNDGKAYDWLDYLSNEAEYAVKYTEAQLNELGLDKVWLQPVMVPKWTRGFKEYAYIEGSSGIKTETHISALGGSIPTPNLGLKAEVIEVHSFDELAALGKEKVEGKIVFFNRPMNPEVIQTGYA